MNRKIYIMKELVGDIEHSEIDFDLQEEFGYDDESHSDFVELTKGHGRSDGEPIAIDRIIETLTEFKRRGATHVSMNYHEDHIGYELSAYKISLAEPALIEAYEDGKRAKVEKQQKIQDLQRQISELRNEAD